MCKTCQYFRQNSCKYNGGISTDIYDKSYNGDIHTLLEMVRSLSEVLAKDDKCPFYKENE